MSQQGLTRSVWLSVAMMTASFLMLVAAIVALIAHAPGTGEAFLAAMVVFGLAGLASAWISRNRARAFVRARQEERRAGLEDSFRKPLP